jgi:hypothetical protein
VAVLQSSQFDQIGFGISAFVEVLKNVFEIVAIATGAIWTYFNFFKGRTYRPRLECRVDGSIETHSGRSLLKVVVKAKNVGLSKVSIEQRGTILQLYPAVTESSAPSSPCPVVWSDKPAVFDVFKDHAWVEPSEPVEDQVLIELPNDKAPAYKLTLKVLSKKISWTGRNIVSGSEEHRIEGGIRDQGPGSDASGFE